MSLFVVPIQVTVAEVHRLAARIWTSFLHPRPAMHAIFVLINVKLILEILATDVARDPLLLRPMHSAHVQQQALPCVDFVAK